MLFVHKQKHKRRSQFHKLFASEFHRLLLTILVKIRAFNIGIFHMLIVHKIIWKGNTMTMAGGWHLCLHIYVFVWNNFIKFISFNNKNLWPSNFKSVPNNPCEKLNPTFPTNLIISPQLNKGEIWRSDGKTNSGSSKNPIWITSTNKRKYSFVYSV